MLVYRPETHISHHRKGFGAWRLLPGARVWGSQSRQAAAEHQRGTGCARRAPLLYSTAGKQARRAAEQAGGRASQTAGPRACRHCCSLAPLSPATPCGPRRVPAEELGGASNPRTISRTPSEEPNSGGGQQATGRGAAHHPPPRPDKVAPPVIPRVQGPYSPQRHEVMAVACLCVPISSAPSSQADVLPYKDT